MFDLYAVCYIAVDGVPVLHLMSRNYEIVRPCQLGPRELREVLIAHPWVDIEVTKAADATARMTACHRTLLEIRAALDAQSPPSPENVTSVVLAAASTARALRPPNISTHADPLVVEFTEAQRNLVANICQSLDEAADDLTCRPALKALVDAKSTLETYISGIEGMCQHTDSAVAAYNHESAIVADSLLADIDLAISELV